MINKSYNYQDLIEMPPKFKRGQREEQDRVQLLGLHSSDEEEEQIFLNSSPHNPHRSQRQSSSTREYHDPKIKHVQDQVSGVISVMKDNIGRVMERGEKLEDLEEKSEGLAESATHFRTSARRLERKMWWKNCKLKLVVVLIILFILGVIIVVIVVQTRK